MDPRLSTLADDNVAAWAFLDPCAAIVEGVAVDSPGLTDYSEEASQERGRLARRTADAARKLQAEVPSKTAGVAAAVIAERCGVEAELYDAGEMQRRLDLATCPLQEIRRAVDLTPRSGEEQWELLVQRLAQVPVSIRSYLAGLSAAAARGHLPARRQVEAVSAQCERLASSGHFSSLTAGYGDGRQRAVLDLGAAAAAAAYGEAAAWLRARLGSRSLDKDAFGRDRYELWARWYTGTGVDLEDAHTWAAAEFVSLEELATAAAAAIDPDAAIGDVVAALHQRPDLQVHGRAEARAWLEQCSREAFEAADALFDIPAELRRLDWHVTDDGGIHYLAPAEDGSRPGTVWWAVVDGEPLLTWLARTTVFHEGVPGHHLQLGLTVLLGHDLTRFQRHRCEIAGYVEGWGLYAERLMDERGLLADPADRLGYLQSQLLRTARVLVDIGMHLGLPIPEVLGYDRRRWSPETGRRFLAERAGLSGSFLAYELDRYLGRPGQAIAYKLGEREWLAARSSTNATSDPQALREFHTAALRLGPMGLDLLLSTVNDLSGSWPPAPA